MDTDLSPEEASRKMLAALWTRNLPVLRQRLAQLDEAAEAAASGVLSSALREEAGNTAHKLAGSLGMFGYPRGTELARQIELLLESPAPVDALTLRQLATALREALNLA